MHLIAKFLNKIQTAKAKIQVDWPILNQQTPAIKKSVILENSMKPNSSYDDWKKIILNKATNFFYFIFIFLKHNLYKVYMY